MQVYLGVGVCIQVQGPHRGQMHRILQSCSHIQLDTDPENQTQVYKSSICS